MADDKQPSAKTSGSKSGGGPLVSLLLILNLLAMGTIAYFQYNQMQKLAKTPTVQQLLEELDKDEDTEAQRELLKQDATEGKVIPLEGFTVNLAQGDGPRRFVRLNTVLKFSNRSDETEFTSRRPQIRDTIIAILNSKRPEDLLKKEGKVFLKEEMKSAINSFLVDSDLIDIYYTGFQIN